MSNLHINVLEADETQIGVARAATMSNALLGIGDREYVQAGHLLTILNTLGFGDTGGGTPMPQPSGFRGIVENFPASGNFIAPFDGQYMFMATGGGGAAAQWSNGQTPFGANGGGGGVIVGYLELSAFETVSIQIGAAGGSTVITYLTSSLTAFPGINAAPFSPPGAGGHFSNFGTHFQGLRGANGQAGNAVPGVGAPITDVSSSLGALSGDINLRGVLGTGSTATRFGGGLAMGIVITPPQSGSAIIVY